LNCEAKTEHLVVTAAIQSSDELVAPSVRALGIHAVTQATEKISI
jgi:hypothetical protein